MYHNFKKFKSFPFTFDQIIGNGGSVENDSNARVNSQFDLHEAFDDMRDSCLMVVGGPDCGVGLTC